MTSACRMVGLKLYGMLYKMSHFKANCPFLKSLTCHSFQIEFKDMKGSVIVHIITTVKCYNDFSLSQFPYKQTL